MTNLLNEMIKNELNYQGLTMNGLFDEDTFGNMVWAIEEMLNESVINNPKNWNLLKALDIDNNINVEKLNIEEIKKNNLTINDCVPFGEYLYATLNNQLDNKLYLEIVNSMLDA